MTAQMFILVVRVKNEKKFYKEWTDIFQNRAFSVRNLYGSHLTANYQQVLLHQVQAPKNLKLKLLANRIEPRFVTCEC